VPTYCINIAIIINVWTAPVIRVEMTAVVGGTVTLSCWTHLPTPVDWYYLPSETAKRGWFLCSAGHLVSDYSERFTLNRSDPGDYSLIIQSVTREEAGVYICREDIGLGTEHRITLTVFGKISISKSCVIRLCQICSLC